MNRKNNYQSDREKVNTKSAIAFNRHYRVIAPCSSTTSLVPRTNTSCDRKKVISTRSHLLHIMIYLFQNS
ncbi:MAG: hypothetical protein AAF378_24210 [Cyanobacteria bacterium P01_A01_bin.84]